jgi:hypothetical protein
MITSKNAAVALPLARSGEQGMVVYAELLRQRMATMRSHFLKLLFHSEPESLHRG